MGGKKSKGANAQQNLGTSLSQATLEEFNKGAPVYKNPLYTGLSSTTQQGIDKTVAAANAGAAGLQNAFNWNNALLEGGGFGTGQQAAMDTIGGIGDEYGQIAAGLSGPSAAETGFTDLYNNAGGPSLTEDQLLSVARGEQFGQNAPGFAALRQQLADDTLTGVNSSFLTDGRFGSSIHAENAGEGLADALAGLDYTNYQNDIGRQERALAAIEGQRQQGFQNQFNSLGAADAARLGQLGAQMGALGAQQGAAQTEFGMGQQGVANSAAAAAAAPGLFQSLLMPGQAITEAGQVQDADALAKRLADFDLFERTNNARTDQIAKFSSILQGAQGMPGTQQETPWWQQALGGAIGLAGAFL